MRLLIFGAAGALACALTWDGAQAQSCTIDDPCATSTTSAGEMHVNVYESDGRRNDSFTTRITGLIEGGPLLFDETSIWAYGNPITQALVDDARVAINAAGGPAVIIFDPVLVDSYEELLDVFTDTSTFERSGGTVVTVQTTSGDAPSNTVLAGERGLCYSNGSSGSTNTAPFDGAFADCDYWDEVTVDPGHVNTNTHTNVIRELVESSFTNEDYMTYEHWQLVGRLNPIGFGHTAAQSGAIESVSGFAARLAGQVDAGTGVAAAPAPLGYYNMEVEVYLRIFYSFN